MYLAIEAVVKKRHERPDNKADNAGIIQLLEISVYRLRVAGDSVVGGRHEQAGGGAHEEEQEDQLLSSLNIGGMSHTTRQSPRTSIFLWQNSQKGRT